MIICTPKDNVILKFQVFSFAEIYLRIYASFMPVFKLVCILSFVQQSILLFGLRIYKLT